MAKTQAKVFKGAFDTYTVVRQVGSGGSGTVFEVADSDGKHLALKLLTQASTSKLKRFRNEINFCLRPASKQIIQVLDFARTDDGALFYVMPLYSSTLKERIKEGITPKEVLGLYSRILDGVEAAHLLSVWHRDLKPANLLYAAGTDDVVVADFGIAHFQEEQLLTHIQTDSDERLANFQYSAPEQPTPGATVDQRADIYALGLILNEMFTRHVPQGTGYIQIQSVAPEFGFLDAVVDLMIRQQLGDRMQSIRKVKEELRARGQQQIEFQRLDALKKQVVPDSNVTDPLIADPIRVVEASDFANGTLALRLNQPVNERWQVCFRMRATARSSLFSSAMVRLDRDMAWLKTDEYHMQNAINMFKGYCESANEEYGKQVRQEHQEFLAKQHMELQRRVLEQETRVRVLGKIQI
jgi:serine/threonine protein kinase